ncbi:hypothetical protein HYDPIDRAFT_67080, partial [Hydnomerulius pinastri MD-312]
AFTMVDTGSTTNFVSPTFTTIMKMPVYTLEQQIMLQLGCIGSRSKLSHGAHVSVCLGPIDARAYINIANIDRYDCILGVPFLREHGICIDFTIDTLRVRGATIPALTEAEYFRHSPTREQSLMEDNIPRLHENWFTKYTERMNGVAPRLPPLREVNHQIPLIDEKKRYTYHLPRCPDLLKVPLVKKICRYMDAGWWEMRSVTQATPMLCIQKKSGG